MSDIYDLLRHVADGAYIIDDQQRITFWNDAAEALLGYSAGEVVGQACYKLIAGRDEASCPICRHNCIIFLDSGRGEPVPNYDTVVHTKSGQVRWLNVSIIAVPGSNAKPSAVIHLFRDVSAKKQAEAFALQVASQARQLQMPDPVSANTRELQSPLGELTRREREILRLLVRGLETPAIATELFISEVTVRNHVQRILQKLGVHSRLEAVAYARKYEFS